MTYRESSRDLFYGDWEQQESRDALYAAERAGETTCIQHSFIPDGYGGGQCRWCPEHVDRWEVA